MVDPTSGSSEITQEDRTLAMVADILVIFTHWLGPLIIFLIKKDQSKFVAFHALQATILGAVATVLTIATMFTLGITALAAFIITVVFGIISALAASRGEWYEMPLIGKFTKQQLGMAA